VCRQWLDLVNTERFSRKEKLLFRCFYDLDVVFKIVKNSQRKILNLDFQHADFDRFSSSSKEFWMDCGSRIKSLWFKHCALSDETLRQVVQFCVVLEYLYFRTKLWVFSPTCLDELVKLQIRRASLTSLSLSNAYYDKEALLDDDPFWSEESLVLKRKQMSENFFYSLFNIYPSIKHLSVYCFGLPEENFTASVLKDQNSIRSTEKLTFGNILRKVVDSRESLETLSFVDNYNDDYHYDHRFELMSKISFITLIPLYFPNLRNVNLYVMVEENSSDKYMNFFSHHKHLQSVKCKLWLRYESWTPRSKFIEFVGQLLNCLFNHCSNLQTLEIISHFKVFELNDSASIKLAKCKLKSYTGVRLEIRKEGLNKRELLTEKLHLLTHVELMRIDDKGLQSIWQYHPCLMSLKLLCRDCTDFGFTGFCLDDKNASVLQGISYGD